MRLHLTIILYHHLGKKSLFFILGWFFCLFDAKIVNDYRKRASVGNKNTKGRNTMKSTKNILLLCCICASFLCSGCLSRAIKEGMGATTGGKGIYQEVDSKRSLSGYSYEIGEFKVVYSKITPHGFVRELDQELKKHLKEKGVPMGEQPGKKLLVINGRILYYEIAGTSGELFGPLEEAVADVVLTDKETGKNVALAVCAGRTTATVARGSKTKAEGIADAITKWIVNRTPELKNKDDDK